MNVFERKGNVQKMHIVNYSQRSDSSSTVAKNARVGMEARLSDKKANGAVQKISKRTLRLRSATVLSPFSKGGIGSSKLIGLLLFTIQGLMERKDYFSCCKKCKDSNGTP